MGLEADLQLNVDEALSGVGTIDDALTGAVQSFKVGLADALDLLGSVQTVDISADASGVTTGIDEAVGAADTTVTPEAQTAGITDQIDQAVAGADSTVSVEADTSNLATEVETAVASITPPEVPIEADTSGVDSALDETSTKASNLGAAGREAGSGLGTIAPAAALATGELGATKEVIGEITPGMVGVTAAAGGLVLAGKDLFNSALEQNTALARLREQFGPLADSIEHVHVGGLNEDLDKLAVRTGANVDGLRNFAASFGQLGKSAGDAPPHIADVAQQIQVLAVRASVLNPNLGTADEIVQRLSTSLARGGRFLSAYGISLSTAQINAEALRETGKNTAADLSIYDKIVAGATLSTQQLGNSLGTDINNGAQKAQIQLRALKAAFEETLKSAGKPLIQPTIDAFRDLEPVLARLAELFGVTLTGALHVVGPLLGIVATVLKDTPTPVLATVAAFAALQRILAGLTFEGLITFLISLPGRAAGAVASLLGIGTAAETAGAETAAGAAEAEAASTGFAAINPVAAGLAVTVGLLAFAWSQHSKEAAAQKALVSDLQKGFADLNKTVEQTVEDSVKQSIATGKMADDLNKLGITTGDVADDVLKGSVGFDSFLNSLQQGGQITQQFHDQLTGKVNPALSITTDAVNQAGQAADTTATKNNVDLVGSFENVQAAALKAAHEVVSHAVATGALSRADEVASIKLHTLADGHVDWIGVLTDLKPRLDEAARAAQLYGDAQTKAADATDPVVAAQDRLSQGLAQAGQKIQEHLVLAGRFTQNQIDTANAVNTNKDGTVDYKAALDQLSPGLGDIVTADGQLAAGLDTTATKFAEAQANAKSFQTALDELLNPVLDASNADVKWHQELDNLSTTLQKNGNTIDLNTKAGQDNVTAINSLVTAGTDVIDKLIAEGAATDVVTAKKAEVIAKLREEEGHYPALKGLIDGYIGQINAIPVEQLTNVGLPNAPDAINTANAVAGAIRGIPQAWSLLFNVNDAQARNELAGLNSDIAAVHAQWLALSNAPGGATGLSRIHAAMAGGVFGPGDVVRVGEVAEETVVFASGGGGFVIPHAAPGGTTAATTPLGDVDIAELGRVLARFLSTQRPIQVNQVAQDPEATAFAVAARLGAAATR